MNALTQSGTLVHTGVSAAIDVQNIGPQPAYQLGGLDRGVEMEAHRRRPGGREWGGGIHQSTRESGKRRKLPNGIRAGPLAKNDP